MKVSLKKLTKKFKSIVAVNELSLEVQKNKTIGILGPNGCGKTTTIGMILGLINPTSGSVEIDDQDINKINRSEILKKINFASPYIELPKKLTVMENLVVYSKLYDIPKKEQRIEELVTDLNLTKIVFKKNGELSSGQKNRVALAKSLINKPKLLLLDEPTASLDPDVGDYVRTYIETYKKNNEITLILASHNMIEVERLCEEVIMMREGNIVDRGSCQDLIKKHGRKNLEETFLKIVRDKKNELE
jgi:ABC-2 type transport system ATP-binding protein